MFQSFFAGCVVPDPSSVARSHEGKRANVFNLASRQPTLFEQINHSCDFTFLSFTVYRIAQPDVRVRQVMLDNVRQAVLHLGPL